MKTRQIKISNQGDMGSPEIKELQELKPDVVFAFGSPSYFESGDLKDKVFGSIQPQVLIGCSTAGEISSDGVFDKSLVLSAVKFEKDVPVKSSIHHFNKEDGSLSAGEAIGKDLHGDDLKCLFVLGQGVEINGSRLIDGLRKHIPAHVPITGGLAGDDGAFQKTYTVLNDNVSSNQIVAIGFYGDNIEMGCGSQGGWQPFGPVRRVTKAHDNILHELDNEPALEVYKKYLGDKADELPGSGLLYPIAILNDDSSESGLIRTILGVDEATGTITLAGDIPEGGIVRLMHSGTDELVDGAKGAAEVAHISKNEGDSLALLISCVGRKLVMGDDTDEEVDAVKEVFGEGCLVTGFYSYGEICPDGLKECKLHNQTMTISHLKEAA